MKKNKKLLIGIGIVVLIGIVTVWIYRNRQQWNDGNVIRIGAILPLTGLRADLGKDCQDGISIALAKLKERGVVNMDVVFADSKGGVKDALAQYHRLRDVQGIKYFIAAFSPVCKALIPEIEKDGNVLVATIASAHEFPAISKNLFRVFVSVDIEASTASKFIVENLNCKKVSMLSLSDDAGQEYMQKFSSSIKELGGDITLLEPFDDRVQDFSSIAAKLYQSGSDALYVYCNDNRIGAIVKAVRVFSKEIPIVTTAAVLSPSNLAQLGTLEKSHVFYPDMDVENGDIEKLPRKNICLLFAHDLTLLLGTAVSKAKSNCPNDVITSFLQLKGIRGAVGDIDIDEQGDASFHMIVKELKK